MWHFPLIAPIFNTAGSDFTSVSTPIANLDLTSNNRHCEDIEIINENMLESDETFSVQLTTSDTSVTLSPSMATVTILDAGVMGKSLRGSH